MLCQNSVRKGIPALQIFLECRPGCAPEFYGYSLQVEDRSLQMYGTRNEIEIQPKVEGPAFGPRYFNFSGSISDL
jgi:hypothetical protein